jgi:hypothetical protein
VRTKTAHTKAPEIPNVNSMYRAHPIFLDLIKRRVLENIHSKSRVIICSILVYACTGLRPGQVHADPQF